MKKAIIFKRWGEVGFGSAKHNGWGWEVELYENDERVDTRYFDVGCQNAIDYAKAWGNDAPLIVTER